MNFYELSRNLSKVDEATSIGSIAFSPSHLGQTKDLMKSLASHKKDWDIELVENDDSTDVDFEHQAKISVPNQYWEEFNGLFSSDVKRGKFSLSEYC